MPLISENDIARAESFNHAHMLIAKKFRKIEKQVFIWWWNLGFKALGEATKNVNIKKKVFFFCPKSLINVRMKEKLSSRFTLLIGGPAYIQFYMTI